MRGRFYREALAGLVEKMGLQDSVRLYGYQPDIRSYLACADCLVFPSVREGLGMAALEALSMGIPVIASDNRGTREYMRDGSNGYVCDVKDSASFAGAIERVCRMRPEELALMRAEAAGQRKGLTLRPRTRSWAGYMSLPERRKRRNRSRPPGSITCRHRKAV